MASCQTCKFSSVLNKQCRFNPPVATILGMSEERKPLIISIFPSIKPEEDWCGQFIPVITQ